jgi:hypothetical protein
LNEGFTDPFNPAASGWVIQNLSSPTSTFSWYQGVATNFTAYVGGPSDYYSVNYNSTTGNGTISNWLITPTLNLSNGAVLSFATRTSTNPASYPDRLEVYMSTAGAGTNVGTTATSVGTFSNLLVSVNPNLTTTGYPGVWTVYTVAVTGVSTPTVGRIGFRYYVTSGGPSGTNSDLIGIDEVKFGNACAATVQSYTVCSGTSATLTAIGASNATYTWSPTAGNNSTLVVNPTSTTVYTLNYNEGSTPCPAVTSTVTIASNLGVSITTSSNTVCSGRTVTLTANSAATQYSWSTGSTAPTITVAPTSNTTYSVGVLNGTCFGGNSVAISTLPNPTVSIIASTGTVCLSTASTQVTYTGVGASTYVWVLGSQAVQQPTVGLNIAAPTATQAPTLTQTLGLVGIAQNGCQGVSIHSLTISRIPTVSVTGGNTVICVNQALALNAALTGTIVTSATYSWSNGGTNAANSYSNSTPGTYTVFVVATNTNGCNSIPAATSVTVDACVGIQKIDASSSSKFFPNPISTQLHISGFTGHIEVFNVTGQMVIRADVNENAVINTAELPKGAYFIQGYNLNGELTKTQKIVKK